MKLPLLLLALLTLTSCANPITPQQSAALSQSAADLHAVAGELHATAAILATQPGTAKAAASAEKAAVVADKATGVANGAAAAGQPGATVVDVGIGAVNAALPFIPPPYQAYVGLGLGLLAIIQTIGKNKANAAATSMQSAVSAGIGNGSITVAPAAVPTMDAIVTNHPAASALIDTITTAAINTPAAVAAVAAAAKG